jgi:hypothetical protein
MHLKLFYPLAFAAFSLLPASLLADTPAAKQWVVTSAKATGGGGAQFVTSLRIVNPNAIAVEADLYFLPQSALDGSNSALGDNSGATKVAVTVPPNQTLALDDVLASKFSTAGAGGIRIESFQAGVLVNPTPAGVWVLSQTLVVNALSSTGVPGTNGFAIPSQNQDQLVALGETAYVPYISASPSRSSGYRTNLFLLSANGTGNTGLTVSLRKSDGTSAGSTNITLGKSSQTQINDIASFFGYVPAASETNLTAVVTVTSGGPVATGASIIDNAIASISYAPPVKMPVANNGAYGLLMNDIYGVSGRAEVFQSAFDYLSASIVIPDPKCDAVFPTLFFFQANGTVGDPGKNSTFTKNADGSWSFAGTFGTPAPEATFTGTILTLYDGSIYGSVTYTRSTGAAGNPCPGVSQTVSYVGTKGQIIQ